jgi:hypothetical protein
MLNISKYLEKIKKNLNSGEILNNTIIEIIQKHTGVQIGLNDFELKNNVILLKTSPGLKNKIFISKNNIIKDIEGGSALKSVEIR